MMPRLEFGHLHKFVASAGLVLLGTAILLPWFLLRESSVLLVTQEQLGQLTPVARNAMQAKQTQMDSIVQFYPWASAFLAIAGTSLLVVGLVGWRRRQLVLDEGEDIDLEVKRRGLQRLTPAESDDRLDAEVKATVLAGATGQDSTTQPDTDARSTSTAPPRANAPAADTEGAEPGDLPGAQRPSEYRAVRRAYLEVEEAAISKLKSAFATTHKVEQGVKMPTGERGSVAADAVALAPRAGGLDIVFEIKYVRHGFAPSVARSSLMQAATMAAMLESGRASQRAAAVVIFVLEDESHVPRAAASGSEARASVSPAFSVGLGVVAISRNELASVSSRDLRERVLEAIGPDIW